MAKNASFTKDFREVKHELHFQMGKQEKIPTMTDMQPHQEKTKEHTSWHKAQSCTV